jgi:hypothetical protein
MSLTDHRSIRPARQNAGAMVAVIAGPELLLAMPQDLSRWWRLTPSAMWASVGPATKVPENIPEGVAALLRQKRLGPRQLILLAAGETGHQALELVLHGALDCAGILTIDIPRDPVPFRIARTAAAIRIVVHRHGSPACGDALLGQLQRADIDQRIIALSPAAGNKQQALASAAESFLLELVAMVGRQSGSGVLST